MFKFLYSLVIVAIHTGVFYYVLFFVYNKMLAAPLDSGGYLMVVLYCAGIVGFFKIMGALKVGYNRQFNIILSHIISLCTLNAIAYIQLSLIHRSFLPLYPVLLMTLIQGAVSIVWTIIVFKLNKAFASITDMLLIYGDKKAEELVYKILEREDQYKICETIQHKPETYTSESNIEEIKEKILNYKAVIIYRIPSNIRNDLLKFCYENDIEVYLPPRISDIIIRGAKELDQFDSPLVICKNCSLTDGQKFFKRLTDIAISVVGIIMSSPIMLAIALAIKIYDGGPVLFKQKRVTLNEKVFEIYKFRSMIIDAEKDDRVIPATDNDPRITPVGKIIRKLRFDELPQLFNILKGDMSFVGPRPERVEHHEAYTELIPEFPFRTKVKAGLTGYAQVMGKYNTTAYDKLLLDLIYIQKFSFFLDIRLILLTVKIIFMKESTEGFKNNKEK
ncbi:MAG: sugar transferase [Clostridia bacterium]|nr:sugar transferase [Clostridia bacterium]